MNKIYLLLSMLVIISVRVSSDSKSVEKSINSPDYMKPRMNGNAASNYTDANHHSIAVVNGDASRQVLEVPASSDSSDPEDPTQPSWGGQCKKDGDTNHYIDGPGPSHSYVAEGLSRGIQRTRR